MIIYRFTENNIINMTIYGMTKLLHEILYVTCKFCYAFIVSVNYLMTRQLILYYFGILLLVSISVTLDPPNCPDKGGNNELYYCL